MAASSSLSLKEYFKRYQFSTEEPKKANKKRNKEKLKPLSTGGGVPVVDKDPVWQKFVQLEDVEEEDNFVGDETPQVEEDIEVKRMKRLQALSLKPYHIINEDGSGWVLIPKSSRPSLHQSMQMDEKSADLNKDLSPSRQRRRRLDTPSPEPKLSGPEGETRDLSPPQRRHVQDLSPPQRAKFHIQEAEEVEEVEAGRDSREDDLSPPRKPWKSKGPSENFSPPQQAWSSPTADLSPPRRTRKRSPDDLSPPRRARKPSLEPTVVQRSLAKETKRGGILSSKEMRETDRKRRRRNLGGLHSERFAAMDPLLSGRGAEAVHRDKEGKKISKDELMKSKETKKEVYLEILCK